MSTSPTSLALVWVSERGTVATASSGHAYIDTDYLEMVYPSVRTGFDNYG